MPLLLNLIAWADGAKSPVDTADECGVPVWELRPVVDQLIAHDLLSVDS